MEVITLTPETFSDKVKEKDTVWFVKLLYHIHIKLWEEMKVRLLGDDKVEKLRNSFASRSLMSLWMIRAVSVLLLWSCFVHLMALGDMWGPRFFSGWPSCFNHRGLSSTASLEMKSHPAKIALRPKRVYQSNGYLMVSCNGVSIKCEQL